MIDDDAEEGYTRALKGAEEEAALIRSGTCPRCFGEMKLTRDGERQAGASQVVGDWHRAKCTNVECGYFCDIVVPQNN